jgi:hypothetical protein
LEAVFPVQSILRTSCHIANSLTKRDGPLGPIFYPISKANIIADFLENQFRVHGLWRFKLKPCWLLSVKTSMFISDLVTSEKKYSPRN